MVIEIGSVSSRPSVFPTARSKVARFNIRVKGAGSFNKNTGTNDDGFFSIEGWGKVAECIETLDVGTKVCVQGSLRHNKYKDDFGVTKESVRILVGDVSGIVLLNEEATSVETPAEPEDPENENDGYDPFS